MSNPLFSNNKTSAGPLDGLMQFLNGGGDPQKLVEQILQQNPQARQLMQQIKNTANGRSPKEMALQLAKQKGIDPDQLIQMVNKVGRK